MISALELIPNTIFPPPWRVASAAQAFLTPGESTTRAGIVPFRGAAWLHTSTSLGRFAVAYALALAVALPLGAALGLSRRASALLDPTVNAFRAIPIFAWLPLAIVWFGLGEGAARYLVFIGAVFPMIIATADSTGRVPRSYVETARMLGLPRRRLLRRVYLPAALPGIVTGMRLGLTLGWMSVIVGELTGTRYGLGAMMFASRETGRLDQVIVGMASFAILGLVMDLLLRTIARRPLAWADR
ncbi:ABC transporter permease [soil metagenome]